MGIVSYAQNLEDVLLARVFPDPTGFYLDVGAAHPVGHSTTKWFYERGWTGVNVEPLPHFYGLLCGDRTRDVNLPLCVSDAEGEVEFHTVDDSEGCSTADTAVAESVRQAGRPVSTIRVRTTTLARICEEYVRGPIDFLKVDVEGHERATLAGMDFQRWRPRVVVVEATVPGSPIPCHEGWEDLIVGNGYLFAFFDGLNRYYVREEEPELAPRLAVPVNVFDKYVLFEHVAEVHRLTAKAEATQIVLAETRVHLDQVRAALLALGVPEAA